MSGIDPRYTLGELALQRDELVRRLVAEGLYDAQSRRSLPAVPLRVGLVTSVGSAAWHDVTEELAGSGFGFQVAACDSRVQGEWAAEMVAAAVRTLGRRPLDVVLVVRGGGARADLATFDSEAVARAIASCPVPVVTGLGHEVDRSVADEVACLALKTPTACAAELVDRVRRFRQGVEGTWEAIEAVVAEQLTGAERALGATAAPGGAPDPRLAGDRLGPAGRARRTAAAPGPADARAGHDHARRRGGPDPARGHPPRRSRGDAAGCGQRSPPPPVAHARPGRGADRGRAGGAGARPRSGAALARGWSITHAADGRVVRSARDVAPGDHLTTTLVDGRVHSRVEGTVESREGSGAMSAP